MDFVVRCPTCDLDFTKSSDAGCHFFSEQHQYAEILQMEIIKGPTPFHHSVQDRVVNRQFLSSPVEKPEEFTCRLCPNQKDFGKSELLEHVRSFAHLEKLIDFFKEPELANASKCTLPSCQDAYTNLLEHVASARHKKAEKGVLFKDFAFCEKLEEALNLGNEEDNIEDLINLGEDATDAHRDIADTPPLNPISPATIDGSEQSLQPPSTSLQAQLSREDSTGGNRDSCLEKFARGEGKDKIIIYRCTICPKDMTGEQPYADHVKGREHNKRLQLHQQKSIECEQNEPFKKVEGSVLRCTLCDMPVSNSKQNWEGHVNGGKHLKQLKIRELSNAQVPAPNIGGGRGQSLDGSDDATAMGVPAPNIGGGRGQSLDGSDDATAMGGSGDAPSVMLTDSVASSLPPDPPESWMPGASTSHATSHPN